MLFRSVTIFDFNFKIAAGSVYSGVALSNYLSIYGSSVNMVSLLCLLLGISNVTRFLGIGIALAAMPIIVGLALLGFLNATTLSFLFILMVGSKAINYALNGPALKQLYIPTTADVKFKAQAWIETFGSRSSKQTGSIAAIAMSLHKPITKTEANNKKKLETWIKGLSRTAAKIAKDKGYKASVSINYDDDGIA
mgnify:CR=1 FL=1